MFCRNCGEVMLETDITCPSCGFAAGTGLKFCAQCGSETPAGVSICEICGNPVNGINGGAAAAFQQQPQFQQQAATAFQQQPQFQQQAQFVQQPQFQQQTVNLQKPQSFQQSSAQTFQSPGAQQFRSADPNAAFQQAAGTFQQPGAFQQNAAGAYYGNVTYKSKAAAGLLGIFLGMFGVHNFYLGYTSKAVIQLCLTLLSCGTLGVVSEIWGIVEGIMIFTGSINKDAKGLPLKD